MGEKEEGEKKEGAEKEEETKKEEEEAQVIVLRVDMHCEACARKVAKSLKGFEGVEMVKVDSKARIVVVKGKDADPLKVCERVQKKSGRKVEIISPLPKPPVEEEGKEELKEEPPPEENKEEPKAITVILKVRMHCEACAQVLRRRIKKIDGVEAVETDLSNERVVVKGFVDPTNLIKNVYQRTRKQASIIPIEEKEEEKKSEDEKKEEKPQAKEEKPRVEEKKEEEEEEEGDKKFHPKTIDSWPPVFFLEHVYAHPPEIFSDENPNACSLM
ncbi:hypothetical protein KSP39_PZI015211 [Platanthera zijinensis]|uniref:HMA domain-containing protein n=1 Tax=Platanthera zijinensis TaxID=2320716 RepID=A0AAP0B9V7_9ASPA